MDASANPRGKRAPTGFRGLLMMTILGGMATAAAIVAILALRSTLSDPIGATTAQAATKQSKPSAFGAVLSSANSPDVKMSPPQIVKAGSQAVVTVTGYDQNDQPIASGTGYIYSTAGMIVTTFGAIRGASSVTVDTANGDELNVIALMGYNQNCDVAVLAVLEGNLPALQTGPADIVQEGDAVVAVGLRNAVSQGVVGTRKALGGVDLIQITAQATAGSPVMNDHGKVIGLVTHKRIGGESVTLAIPSRYISDVLAQQRVISFAQMNEETHSTPASSMSGN
jgi:S1-C subfamily serine protease